MTTPAKPGEAVAAWQDVQAMASPLTRSQVRATVHRHAEDLAARFYAALLSDPQAGQLLDHAIVNQRLHASLVRWLTALFDERAPLDSLVAAQQTAGEVHARVGVPMAQVAHGARVLKRAIAHHLAHELAPSAPMAEAVQYVHELVDVALDTMNASTSAHATRMNRSVEACRLFFLTQNLKAERERQKTQLLEWAHQMLMRHYWDVNIAQPGPSGRSPLELWLQHKASVLFEHAPELAQMQVAIAHIEGQLLPTLSLARHRHDEARDIVNAIHQQVEGLRRMLDAMFDRVSELDDGRDGVTRLLNRRYFPAVVKREMALAQKSRGSFALLLLDIDRFQAVRQTLGLEAADLVLSQVADVLSDSVRAGDFVFRVGDDQFLVLLADASDATVQPIADGLRQRISQLVPRTPGGASTALTVSIGVASHDGHPDYLRLLERTEAALRQAKAAGRNRVVLAPPTQHEPN